MYPFGTIYNIAFKTIKICERIHPLSEELPHLVQGKADHGIARLQKHD